MNHLHVNYLFVRTELRREFETTSITEWGSNGTGSEILVWSIINIDKTMFGSWEVSKLRRADQYYCSRLKFARLNL